MKTSLILLATVIGTALAIDYCQKDLCSDSKHIACHHNGQFQSKCPKNAALVPIDGTLQQLIVDAFNKNRNFIAGGGDREHKPACRMATMEWDAELAKLAELNVKQCEMEHDCHDTKAFPLSGQNLAWSTYHGTPDHVTLIKNGIQGWYDEIKDSKMSYIKKYPSNTGGAVIGHFTAMVADRNFRLGCAAATYEGTDKYWGDEFLFACNFAFTNMEEEPIYVDCPTAGKDCVKGKNPKYPNLCSTSEQYKVSF